MAHTAHYDKSKARALSHSPAAAAHSNSALSMPTLLSLCSTVRSL